MKNKKLKILNIFILILSSFIIVASFYVDYALAGTEFETTIFYSISDLNNADMSIVYEAFCEGIPIVIVLSIIILFCFYDIKNTKINKSLDKYIHINKHKWLYTIIYSMIAFILLIQSVKIPRYIYDMSQKSDLIEKEYITPKKESVEFNDNKRNLIIITVESLEYSFFTKKQNGIWDYDLIPELYDLLQEEDTTTFNSKKGMYMLHGTSYTSSSVVANTSGVPIKIGLDRYGYTGNNFMKGNYALGDLLKDNGYTNEIISGAKTSYGGLDYYYNEHGKFKIIDPDTLDKYGYKLKEDDYGRWGFNDKYLFELGKERADNLAKEDKPFNLELLTIDTHYNDGFVGNYSETKYKKQYENAYATTSKLIVDYINYIRNQPYYENTTIIVMGDHLTMQSNFLNDKMFNDRTIYFCIINSDKEKQKKDRIFTAIDTYPTILSSIGGIIEEDRLGLGVNLYSDKQTLAEKYGVKQLDKELRKKSEYYDKKILKKGE